MTTRGGDGSPEASGGGQFLLQLLQKPPQHSPTPPQPPPPLQPSSSFDPAISYSSDTFYHPPRHHHNLPFAPHVFFPQNPISNYPGFNQVDQLHQNPIFDRPLNPNIANSFNGNVNESITRRNCGEVEGGRGSNGYGGSHRAVAPPPGFVSKSVNGGGDRRSSDQIMDKGKSVVFGREIDTTNKWKYSGGIQNDRGLSSQHYGSRRLHAQGGQGRDKFESGASQKARQRDLVDDLEDRLASVLELVEESGGGTTKEKANGPRDKGKTIFVRETDSNNKWKYNNGIQNDGGVSSRFNHVPLNDFEESAKIIHAGARKKIGESGNHCQSDLVDNREDQIASVLELVEESEGGTTKEKAKGSRDKDYRTDKRGKWILNQRMRIMKRKTTCRRDIDRLSAPFLAIYESLIPPKEEKEKQEKLLTLLRSLVKKEWPEAQLYVYGSCGNSFGFTKSDIDICLVIQNMDINKSEVLLKLAETLESNNLQNVQALTRARVPIVKLMDPDTGISCDICINNILAVINTKLLRDYARIDGRLRQLAFIVKHWAKTRGVNETYQGTLSSYAYVLMCISFLQQRKPAILPCLQEMEATYSVTVENTECAYFSEVDKLNGFGARNGETISHLVWAFFNYWAYYHDYTNDVISVRTGGLLSKEAKDWTRRIGNDRHLMCIEDPFEITHDLGRVVDKSSIRVLREEFERAADIMQHDSDPCRSLFEPYVPH